MADARIRAVITADDRASSVLAKFANSAGGAGDFVKKNMNGAAVAAAGLILAMGSVTKVAVDQAAAYQQNRVAFETMLGSAGKARDLLRDLSTFAAQTPFELPEVVTGAKNLLAFGIAAEDIIPTFRTIGNIASAVGTENLPNIVRVFGQIKVAGRAMTQDLMQFTQAGVPIIDELAKHFHTTGQGVRDLTEQGKVGFEDVKAAMEQLGGPQGRWGDLMAKQSQTFSGTLSNVRDQLGRVMRLAVGITPEGDIRKGSLFDVLIQGANKLLAVMNAISPKIEAVTGFFESHRVAIIALLGAFAGLVVLLGVTLVVAFGSALLLMAAFAAAGAAIAAIAYLIVANWGSITAFFQGIWTSIVGAMTSLWGSITSIFVGIYNTILGAMSTVWNVAVAPVLNNIKAAFHILSAVVGYEFAVIRGLAIVIWGWLYPNLIAPVFNAIKAGAQAVGNFLGSIWNWIASVARGAWGAVSGAAGGAWNYVVGLWRGITGFFSGVWNSIAGGASNVGGRIAGAFQSAFSTVQAVVKSAVNWMVGRANTIIDGVNNTAGKLPGVPNIGHIPYLASGTDFFQGGLAVVGERGPELVSLPRGSSVTPNHKLGTSATANTTVNVTFSGVFTGNEAEFRKLALKVFQAAGDAAGAKNMTLMDFVS